MILQEVILGFHNFEPYLPPKLETRFPSLLRMDVLPSVDDKGIAKNMLACVLSALKSNGKIRPRAHITKGTHFKAIKKRQQGHLVLKNTLKL